MEHIDPEDLALIALDDLAVSDDRARHIRGCPACAAELASLRETVRVARTASPSGLDSPPPEVWTRITHELGLGEEEGPVAELADPIPLRPRRARWWVVGVAVAACIALIVGLVGGLWFVAPGGGVSTIVAQARLDPFPGWPDASGSADLEDESDGTRSLVVHLDAPAPSGDFREVWLISSDASRLVSLGVLTGADGRFLVPADVDLADYPLVDVSSEPVDGDPAHSGDSIVRGSLAG